MLLITAIAALLGGATPTSEETPPLEPLTALEYGRAFCTGTKDGQIYFAQDFSGDYGIIKISGKLSPMARMNGRIIDFDNIPWLGANTIMKTHVIGKTETIVGDETDSVTNMTVKISYINGMKFGEMDLKMSCGL